MKNKIFFILAIFCLLSLSCFAEEDKKDWVLDLKTSTLIPNYVGKVKVIRGKVMVGENELSKGDKVYPKSVVKTADKSFIVIELIDETLLTLGPSTEFTVEKWAFKSKSDREAMYSLLVGKMRAEIKVKSKEDDKIIVKSPLVAMGIRGTEVLLNHSIVNGKLVSQVGLIEGKVMVKNVGTDKKMDMVANDYVEVTEGKEIPEIEKKLTAEEIKKYNAIVAPDEKLLMDYPVRTEIKSKSSSGVDGKTSESAVIQEEAMNTAGSANGKIPEATSWKENLKKLNDLRKK